MTIDGEAGFTQESFSALQNLTNRGPQPIIVNVTIDEMAIREQVQSIGKKLYGYVDLGMNCEGADIDCFVTAKQALVVMATSINSHWKVPLGYFMINGLGAEERAKLLITCLKFLSDVKVKCHSVTFDGAAVNLAMSRKLGCKFANLSKLWLDHPHTKEKIFIFLNPCHMVKLIRNALRTIKVIKTEKGLIKWDYIEILQQMQEKEGLRLGNKLTKRHTSWQNEKMNVRLAVQTLSKSVSDALIFCSEHYPSFQQSKETSEFLCVINDAFDIMNSRNFWAKTFFNQKIHELKVNALQNRIYEIVTFLSTLKINGTPSFTICKKNWFSRNTYLLEKFIRTI